MNEVPRGNVNNPVPRGKVLSDKMSHSVSNPKPQGSIKNQAQTSLPTNGDDTIMDDTSAIMDDTSALMGGLTVTHSAMRSNVKNTKPASPGI